MHLGQIANPREARCEDAQDIARLINQLGYAATPTLVLDHLRRFRENPCDTAFVVTDGAHIAGYISLHVYDLFHAQGRLAE